MKKKLLACALLASALPGPAQGAAARWGGFTGYETKDASWFCDTPMPGLFRFLRLPCDAHDALGR